MTKHFVSVKTAQHTYKVFYVPREVYVYIRQLECAIKYSSDTQLKVLYPERFGENNETN